MFLTTRSKIKRLVQHKIVATPGLICRPVKELNFRGCEYQVKIKPRLILITVRVGVTNDFNIAKREIDLKSMLYWCCVRELKIRKPIEIKINFQIVHAT